MFIVILDDSINALILSSSCERKWTKLINEGGKRNCGRLYQKKQKGNCGREG